MTNSFPVLVCVVGAIADFVLWMWLRNFKVRDKAPASQAHLSRKERQRRITIAGRIVFGSAWFFLAAAGLLWWLGNR